MAAVHHSRVVSAGRRLAQYCGRFWFSANQRRVPFVPGALETVIYWGPEFHGLGGFRGSEPPSSVSFGVFGPGAVAAARVRDQT